MFDEILRLSNVDDLSIDQEHNSFFHKHLSDALKDRRTPIRINGRIYKDIWKEMRNLGLLPKRKEEDLHGHTPGNAHFAGISVSPLENIEDAMNTILSATEKNFSFKPVGLSDVVIAICHFSQARGVDGVPQKVIVKALPDIGEYLVKIFNSSFAQGGFPSSWKRAQVIALK